MNDEKRGTPPVQHEVDRGVGQHVEKKPESERGGDSPQKTHDDEDQG